VIGMAIGHWNESVTDLIPGYRQTKRMLEKARENTTDKVQRSLIGGAISDKLYELEWLETGRRPGSRRGIEKGYKVSSWDPAWLDAYASPTGRYTDRTQFTGELTADDRFRIEEAMRDLSQREKQCYVLYHVDGMDEYEIARELNLGRSTVHEYMERATTKIENAKLTSLFLWK
jgi:RNA polymerase sigma factor (sigma-70 family)